MIYSGWDLPTPWALAENHQLVQDLWFKLGTLHDKLASLDPEIPVSPWPMAYYSCW